MKRYRTRNGIGHALESYLQEKEKETPGFENVPKSTRRIKRQQWTEEFVIVELLRLSRYLEMSESVVARFVKDASDDKGALKMSKALKLVEKGFKSVSPEGLSGTHEDVEEGLEAAYDYEHARPSTAIRDEENGESYTFHVSPGLFKPA